MYIIYPLWWDTTSLGRGVRAGGWGVGGVRAPSARVRCFMWARKVSAKLLARIHHNKKRRPATWRGRAAGHAQNAVLLPTAVYHGVQLHPEPSALRWRRLETA